MDRMLGAAGLVWLAGCAGTAKDSAEDAEVPPPVSLRVATYNVSLHRSAEGELLADLSDPTHPQAVALAAIVQDVRPDVVLLNEVDFDADGASAQRLVEDFFGVGQGEGEALDYPYVLVPEVNTGVASGVDLNQDGQAVTEPGSDAYGQDAKGYGQFPGQYGMVVLSRYPISSVRTFQNTLWKDVVGAWLPDGYYSDEALAVLPLSSKTHADVALDIGGHTVHLLASHPTPPSFDGDEDRNGRRNHDEITFWADYLDAGPESWHTDDALVSGGLDGADFVVVGDLNADPADGGSSGDPMATLLGHPSVQDPQPDSEGGTQAAEQGGVNPRHEGDPRLDTADFSDASVGNLRVDYVLPSVGLRVVDSGVFWPVEGARLAEEAAAVSDHRLVWVDLVVGE